MKIKPDFQSNCTLTTFRGDSIWEALRTLADYLDQEDNFLEGIYPTAIEVDYNDREGYWIISLITDYEVSDED